MEDIEENTIKSSPFYINK